eukprot:CAMPEP_0167749898 /NCGR_PEP_ID=MMETSP0110_2-20121227/5680_1 /TAXON_ID=629695 /ORGANISM="Gymnochlora sp., Strain CCMP2014" /LENGTH=102 /DNA_ID=CAMNT_0007635137 /DNA_START=13 /DNA_END=321 /DNA_ORIENTATION=+
MSKDLRFYAANIAAAGLLISAVKFPSSDALVPQLELASVVALMNRLPGAGILGTAAAIISGYFTYKDKKEDTPIINKSILIGTAGGLCLSLFLDKNTSLKLF